MHAMILILRRVCWEWTIIFFKTESKYKFILGEEFERSISVSCCMNTSFRHRYLHEESDVMKSMERLVVLYCQLFKMYQISQNMVYQMLNRRFLDGEIVYPGLWKIKGPCHLSNCKSSYIGSFIILQYIFIPLIIFKFVVFNSRAEEL